MQAEAVVNQGAIPPGPDSGRFGFKLFPLYQSDPIAFIKLAASYGDFVHVQLGPQHTYLISNLDYLHQILITDADKYDKAQTSKKVLGKFLGEGLILSDGDFWRRQRRLAQPAFHHKRIDAYAQQMVDLTLDQIQGWQNGQKIDIRYEMMRLTLRVISKTMFSADSAAVVHRIDEALAYVQRVSTEDSRRIFTFDWLPSARNRKWREAIETLNGIAEQVISERRAAPTDNGDLLSMLLMATDENGGHMSNKQARDEFMTIFLAGHDTTALALMWTWYLLAKNPHVQQKLFDEVDSVLQGRPPTLNDLPRLPYVAMVAKETLRLYPSAWLFLREANTAVKIGGYQLKKGDYILISPFTMHRNPTYFPEPEVFNPERFSPENEAKIPKFAYLPFSAGPRICIGNSFAVLEQNMIIATIAQRFQLSLPEGYLAIPEPLITLNVKDGMHMYVQAR